MTPLRALVLYVPLTTQNRMSRYEVGLPKLPFLDQLSFASVQGLASIPTVRLERRLGRLPASVMAELRVALLFVRFNINDVTSAGGRCDLLQTLDVVGWR